MLILFSEQITADACQLVCATGGNMATDSSNFISVLLLIISILSLWVWKVSVWLWWNPRKLYKLLREQGFNGNPPKFLFGDTKEMQNITKEAQSKPIDLTDEIAPRVFPFLLQTVKRYGPLSFTWYGVTPRVNIMDPKLIRVILLTNSRAFYNLEPTPLGRSIMQGLVAIEEEKWVTHRKIMNRAFHLEKLMMMVPAMYASCVELINKWEKLVLNGSCEVDVCPDMRHLTGDVISRTAFGSNYEEGQRIFELHNEQAKLVSQANQSIYFPGFRFVPTRRNRRIKELDREARSIVTSIIKKRESAIKDGEAHDDDLLGLLLDSNSKQIQVQGNSKNSHMTMNEIIEECLLFYLAGKETTSALLTWTMVLLGVHQEWQARAREEVMQVFGENEPKYEELNQLRIVTMILYEVLRLYPPVETITKYNPKESIVGSITLPPGVQIGIPTLLVHRDYELWGKDAQEFKPERFSQGVSKVTQDQFAFIPFSSGPRICIGYNFTMIEAKMAIALILKHFSFQLSPTYIHAPHVVLVMEPQHGAPIILHKL